VCHEGLKTPGISPRGGSIVEISWTVVARRGGDGPRGVGTRGESSMATYFTLELRVG
jgi:hypothetical protein